MKQRLVCLSGAAFVILASSSALPAKTDSKGNYCGIEGNWIQILGSGGAELDDRRAGVSYIVWIDGKAKLLVDAGPGTALRFDESGAKLEDLDAILFTQLQAAHTSDLIDLIAGCLLYTSPSPRDRTRSRMPSSA